MNTPIVFSTYRYVLVSLFESAWITLLVLDRQARRDIFKVFCFVRATYQIVSSTEMLYKYRRFAEMCSRVGEILWLIIVLIACSIVRAIEHANIPLQPTSAQLPCNSVTRDSQLLSLYRSANTQKSTRPKSPHTSSSKPALGCQLIVLTDQQIQNFNIRELKRLAAAAKIPNYGRLSKAQLQAALLTPS